MHASWITRCLYDHLYPMLVHSASIKALMISNACKHMQHTHDTTFVHGQDRSLSAIRPSAFGPDPQLCWRFVDAQIDAPFASFCILLHEPYELEVSQGGFLPLSRMSRQSIEFPPYLVKARASNQLFPVSSSSLLCFLHRQANLSMLFNAFKCFSMLFDASQLYVFLTM